MRAGVRPAKGLIHARFDTGYGTGEREIARHNVPQLPVPGQLINIKGHPYTVRAIDWAIDPKMPGTIFAYVKVGNGL